MGYQRQNKKVHTHTHIGKHCNRYTVEIPGELPPCVYKESYIFNRSREAEKQREAREAVYVKAE